MIAEYCEQNRKLHLTQEVESISTRVDLFSAFSCPSRDGIYTASPIEPGIEPGPEPELEPEP